MNWVRRIGRHPPPEAAAPPHPPAAAAVDRASPGVAALFERIVADGSHAVLDLGPADGLSLGVYSRYARWVRFADVLGAATSPSAWPAARETLPPNPRRPYDIVFAWDILDRLRPRDRPGFVAEVAKLCAPDARIFVVLESPDESSPFLPRFALASVDRMRFERTGDPRPVHPPVQPAEVKGLLEPFRVQRAVSTRVGLREYVGVRE